MFMSKFYAVCSVVAVLVFGLVGCQAPVSNTFTPHAYRNIKTWDVDFLLVDAGQVTETTTDASGKSISVTQKNGQSAGAWSVREDLYYYMKGRAGYDMVTKGDKADATVRISFDSYFFNGNFGVINLTVFNRAGEPISRLKIENHHPKMDLESRNEVIKEIVEALTAEVLANR